MDLQSKPEDAAKLFAEWMELRMTDLSAVIVEKMECRLFGFFAEGLSIGESRTFFAENTGWINFL